MKTKWRMLFLVFLAGVILGAMEPALVLGGETPGGNIWDQFVYTKPFKGTVVNGYLTIYYEIIACDTNCPGDCAANMFYTVKLIKEGDPIPYVFQGSSQTSYPNGICLKDVLGQGAEITNFLTSIVSGPPLFPNGVVESHVTAINNGQYNDQSAPPSRAFVADVVITVKARR